MNKNNNARQYPIEFAHFSYMGKNNFIKAPCNAEAFDMIDMWPHWPNSAVCIYGPYRCGKTHLSHIFAEKVAVLTQYPYFIPQIEAKDIDMQIPPLLFSKHRCLIVENLEEAVNEEAIFHLFNLYRNEGGYILFTSAVPPARLNFTLPDLQSRLNMIPAIAISKPDDELLSSLIMKLFMDRQIVVSDEVINYMVINMQRSFSYAHKLVEEIDNISLSYKRAISVPIVKEAIEALKINRQCELF